MPLQDAIDAADSEYGLANKVRVYLAHCKGLAAGGITFAEFSDMLWSLLRLLVAAADSVPADGPQRKQWVLHAIGAFFDEIADLCVPLYLKPLWYIVRPAARTLVLQLASSGIETILPLIRGAK